jgi:ubiquinol-cytochrome c reductase iron-sulfur subunit
MPIAKPTGDWPALNRRGLLYAATAAVGAVGIAAAAWPLLDQMNPDARVRAAGNTVGVDLDGLQPAERRVLRWQNFPVFVVRRTPAMLKAMQETAFVATLVDPDSAKRQQPAYAKNWHRSIDPAYAVLVGVCTACQCVPEYLAETSALGMAGGYICPCCASHYDPAGRASSGLAQFNLPVPPYAFAGPSKILIGKNAADDKYSLETVERI